ncbi:MAG: SpoIIIAH-like family protein [Christensenellales bacterium]
MSKKKKIIILSIMMFLLVVTGVLNIVLNNNLSSSQASTTVTTGNFFVTYRTDRQSTRDQELLYYDAILNSETVSADSKNLAESKKLSLISTMETELVTEGLIKAQGFEDCVVTSSASCVNVIVKSGELSSGEVKKIVAIVKEQTGAKIDNIKIIPVE